MPFANESLLILFSSWPAVAMLFLLVYHKSVCGLIARIRHIKLLGFESDFDPPQDSPGIPVGPCPPPPASDQPNSRPRGALDAPPMSARPRVDRPDNPGRGHFSQGRS